MFNLLLLSELNYHSNINAHFKHRCTWIQFGAGGGGGGGGGGSGRRGARSSYPASSSIGVSGEGPEALKVLHH